MRPLDGDDVDLGSSWMQELLRREGWTRRLARGLLGDDDAEDAVQEIWVAALRHPPDAERPLDPWLRTAVRNRAASRSRQEQRRRHREAALDPPEEQDSAEALLARRQLHRLLVQAVARLAAPYRQAILWRYFEGLTSAQIADRHGIPAGTVRGRLRTALQELRRTVAREARQPWRQALGALAPERRRAPGLFSSRALAIAAAVAVIAAAPAAVPGGRPLQQPATGAPVTGAAATTDHRSSPGSWPGTAIAEQLSSLGSSLAPPAPRLTIEAIAHRVAPDPPRPAVVMGTVRLVGPVPPRRDPLAPDDPACPRPEDVVAGPEGELADVAVWISDSTPPPARPAPEATVEQRGCWFQPRVQVIRTGQVVALLPGDTVVHRVRAVAGDQLLFEGRVEPGAPPLRRAVAATGQVVTLGCDLHRDAQAFLIVQDTPYAAVTREDGRFTLSGVPPGRHTVDAWHERLGRTTAEVEVDAWPGATSSIRVTFGVPPPAPPRLLPCAIATGGDSPVARACRRGGVQAAKQVMKTMLKAARNRQKKFECDDCHRDESAPDWLLRADARDRFEALRRAAE
jgi:RNA polymerase sigma factor (sigma-70 family)